MRRIQIEAQQNEAKAIGEQKANIARAEGIKQSNVLQAEGEAQAITIIDQQLRNNPTYLEWLKVYQMGWEITIGDRRWRIWRSRGHSVYRDSNFENGS